MIICLCEGVSEREVNQAIKEGARSIRDIRRACGAGGGCGGCHDQLLELLEQEKSLDNAVDCAIATCDP
jgi:bacterioferritin-associated ferredoxin